MVELPEMPRWLIRVIVEAALAEKPLPHDPLEAIQEILQRSAEVYHPIGTWNIEFGHLPRPAGEVHELVLPVIMPERDVLAVAQEMSRFFEDVAVTRKTMDAPGQVHWQTVWHRPTR